MNTADRRQLSAQRVEDDDDPSRWNGVARVSLGVGLLVHGLGHSVLLARGAGAIEAAGVARAWGQFSASLALVGFLVAGLGRLGVRPLRTIWSESAFIATLASVGALISFGDQDLAVGLMTDAIVVLLVGHPRFARVSAADSAPTQRRRRFRVARDVLGGALALHVTAVCLARPWTTRWGATDREVAAALPWDGPGRDPAFEVNHVVEIAAPPEKVWPWLVQLGQDRGGFYSYSTLENLCGARITNADAIHPEWQGLAKGDFVRAVPPDWLGGLFGSRIGWNVAELRPNEALVLDRWGAFVLLPGEDGSTRLLVRGKVADRHHPVWAAALSLLVFEPIHFAMERAMLLGIRDRVEGR